MKSLRFLTLLVLVAAFAGCKKEEDELVVRPDYGKSYLRIIHAGLGVDDVDLYADYLSVKQRIAHNFGFGEPFPDSLYLTIQATIPAEGAQYPRYVLYTHDPADSLPVHDKINVVEPRTIVLRDNQRHSLFLVDSVGIKTWIAIEDPQVQYGADSAGVFRFVNTSNTQGITLETTFNGNTVSAAAPNFGNATGYQSLEAGTYTFRVVNSTGVEMASTTITIPNDKAVTIYYVQPAISFGSIHHVYMD